MATSSATLNPIANRIKGAWYGLLIGDALAMPTHWFYGGAREVQQTYGTIKSYVAPKTQKAGSIMPKSNTGGGGRGSYKGDVIGKLIFHDKKKYWKPGTSYHYHQGMSAGDNTLEGLLFRRVSHILSTNGCNKESLTSDYIEFMTTPGTHNDTYCGTCHRMFFANREAGKPIEKCPDNDGHNVDSADALVAAVPAMLFSHDDAQAAKDIETVISFTRNSPTAIQYGKTFSTLLRRIIRRPVQENQDLNNVIAMLVELSDSIGFDVQNSIHESDPVTAWYLAQSFPAMLHMATKYMSLNAMNATETIRDGLLANANRGGENVATGALLGALFGATVGFDGIPKDFLSGLATSQKHLIDIEIENFINSSSFATSGGSDGNGQSSKSDL